MSSYYPDGAMSEYHNWEASQDDEETQEEEPEATTSGVQPCGMTDDQQQWESVAAMMRALDFPNEA